MKKIIIIIIICIIIISIILISLLLIQKKQEDGVEEPVMTEEEEEEIFQEESKLKVVDDWSKYFNIQECINIYTKYSNNFLSATSYGDTIPEEEKEYIDRLKQQLPDIFPEFVKEELNVNENNMHELLGVEKDNIIRINKIYEALQTINTIPYEEETSIYAYVIDGVSINKNTYSQKDFNIILVLDNINSTFFIIPERYIEQKGIKLSEGINIDIYTEKEIEENDNNIFTMKYPSKEEIATKLFADYKSNLTYDIQYVYELLNEEYREKRFTTIESFKQYVEKNKEKIQSSKMNKYVVNEYDEYTEYICVDQSGNMYIFNETISMDYEILLDIYTKEIPYFTGQYKKLSEEQKITFHIKNVIDAINDENYKYVYARLSEEFKANNYSTQKSFEQYISSKLYTSNEVESSEYIKQGDIYIFKMKIVNKDNKENSINMNIIMQLQDETDFVMSFSFE